MPSPEESQLKLHLKTSLSKLQYKLNKSRILSNQTLQTKIIPSLKNLQSLSTPATEDDGQPVQSRQFERSLELTRVIIGEMVRRDRHADVWEDLIGELGLLDGSIGRISGMADEVIQRENERLEFAREEKERLSKKTGNTGGSIWSFWKQLKPQPQPQPEIEPETEPEQTSLKNIEEQQKKVAYVCKYDPLTPEGQDRYTKIIRNTLVAEWFIGDEIKELHKLKIPLSKCIDKEVVHKCSTKDGIDNLETIVKKWYQDQIKEGESEVSPKMMDLEDRTLIEIIRKLRGDDEESVIDDYLNEIVDIYRIDLYSTGKYDIEEDGEDEDTVDEDEYDEADDEGQKKSENPKSENKKKSAKADSKSSSTKPKPLDSKKKLSDLDALKKRFDDLKRL